MYGRVKSIDGTHHHHGYTNQRGNTSPQRYLGGKLVSKSEVLDAHDGRLAEEGITIYVRACGVDACDEEIPYFASAMAVRLDRVVRE